MEDPASALEAVPTLRIRQEKEWAEIWTGWETRNRYRVEDPTGRVALHAAETGGGAGALLARSFLQAWRPFTIEVRDGAGSPVLSVRRPFRLFLPRAEVLGSDGRLLGAVQGRLSLRGRCYALEDAGGREVGRILGPWLRPWTFRIFSGDREVGVIRKRWSGLFREAASDADDFELELGPALQGPLRSVALGATFLIDFAHFESNG